MGDQGQLAILLRSHIHYRLIYCHCILRCNLEIEDELLRNQKGEFANLNIDNCYLDCIVISCGLQSCINN